MFRNKNKTTNNSLSLEQRTDNSWYDKAKLGLAAAGFALFTSIFGGCNAHYYRSVKDTAGAESFMAYDYHGSQTGFIQQLDKTETVVQPSVASDAYVNALVLQNKTLATILNSAKDLIVNSLKRNTDNDSLDNYAVIGDGRMREIRSYMDDLEDTLELLTPEVRAKLAQNSALAGALQDNKRLLNAVDMLYSAIADIETIEGNIGIVAGANARSAAIRRSLYGVDQYEQEGKSTYEEIKGKQLGEVVSADSFVAKAYDLTSNVAGVVDDILKQINEEAVSRDDESLHVICNKHLGNLLNIASEYRKKLPNSEESDAKCQALVRYFTREAYMKMKDYMSELEKCGEAGLGSVITPSVLLAVAPFVYCNSIFTTDHYDADGSDFAAELSETLKYGNAVKNGFGTRHTFAGSLHSHRTKFWAGVVYDLALIAGAVGGGFAYSNSQRSDAQAQSYNPVTQGGETGGPGTQN